MMALDDAMVAISPRTLSRRLTLSVQFGSTTMHFGARATVFLFAILGASLAFSAVSSLYIGFHDQMVASMAAQQSDDQSNYEDQIALLRRDKELALSRQLVDHHTLSTVVQSLVERAAALEARTASIERLSASIDAAERGEGPGLNDMLNHANDGEKGSRRADATLERLGRRLARVSEQQLKMAADLQKPAEAHVERFRRALSEIGISPARYGSGEADVGGPFVPLPAAADADGFAARVAHAQQMLEEESRLSGVVDHVPLHVPLDGGLEVTSPFGARTDPFLGKAAFHTGIDLRQTAGDVVFATAAGVVTVAGPSGGYGDMVEVDHGHGLATRYAHLSSIDVVVGQHVDVRTAVGRIGSTGRATGPHLHYETRVDGEAVDPARFLRAALRLGEKLGG